MPHRKGSFHEDWNELLSRFARRGTPAAIEDQIEEAKQDPKRRSLLDLHEALFERSKGDQRPATNSQIE